MPVAIPAEVVIAVLVGLAIIVAVAAFEVFVAVRAARRTRIPLAGVALMASGLVIGLVQVAFEWIHPYGGWPPGPIIALLIILAVVVLAVVVSRLAAPGWLAVALLGAGVLYQFGWVAGRHVLPGAPLIGDALWAAHCERDQYCSRAAPETQATVDLRIEAPGGATAATGAATCIVDERPIAAVILRLNGTLPLTGDSGSITFEATLARDDDPTTPQQRRGMLHLEGPIGGFDQVTAEASGATFTAADEAADPAWRAGTITFARLQAETLQPVPEFDNNVLWRHEPALDSASGTLSWTCLP